MFSQSLFVVVFSFVRECTLARVLCHCTAPSASVSIEISLNSRNLSKKKKIKKRHIEKEELRKNVVFMDCLPGDIFLLSLTKSCVLVRS